MLPRGRINLTPTHRHVEDAALDAARADQQAAKHTLVIAQTSNDHLDQVSSMSARLRLIGRQASRLRA